MKRLVSFAVLLFPLGFGLGAAKAQLPSLPSTRSLPSGLSGLAGGLPSMSSVSSGNAAGVLGYCVKNKLLGNGGGASSVLSGLTGKPGVTSSSDYTAGESGQLGSGSSALSLDSLSGKMKTKACDMVLKNAKSML